MRLLRWNRTRPTDAELSDELKAHLLMAIAEKVERGESPAEARAEALREFGNLPLVRAVTRQQWGGQWIDAMVRDLKHAVRRGMLRTHREGHRVALDLDDVERRRAGDRFRRDAHVFSVPFGAWPRARAICFCSAAATLPAGGVPAGTLLLEANAGRGVASRAGPRNG